MKPAPVLLCLGVVLAACESKTKVSHVPREDAVKIAREAAQDAFQQLSGELAKAIEHGGPVAAIPVCSIKAESLVLEVSGKRKVTMIRLSDRPRNPKQLASGADLIAMDAFRAASRSGEAPAPQIEELADGTTMVRIPIPLGQPLCLQCHGSEGDIAPDTRKAILAAYPDDKATGYQLNDLRGIWRIGVSPQ